MREPAYQRQRFVMGQCLAGASLALLVACTRINPGPVTVVATPPGGAATSGPEITGSFTLDYSLNGFRDAKSGGGCLVLQHPGEPRACETHADCQEMPFLPIGPGANGYCLPGEATAKSCWFKPADAGYCAKFPGGLAVGDTKQLPLMPVLKSMCTSTWSLAHHQPFDWERACWCGGSRGGTLELTH
jgi:hypothetical protein